MYVVKLLEVTTELIIQVKENDKVRNLEVLDMEGILFGLFP